MERTRSYAFLSVSSRDCSRGKSSSSGGFITSLAVVSSEAGGEGTANASPVWAAASSWPRPICQETSAHTIPNNCVKAGQSVPKISGCLRWELTATSILYIFPRNVIDTGTNGNPPPPRAPSIPGPPQRQKDGQGIVGERRTVLLRRALVPPLAGGTFPPGRYHSAGGLEGPPKSATWEPVPGEGERGQKEVREREREISEGLAHPGARHQMVLRQLDGLRQRRRVVALDPLSGSTGQPSDELFQHHQIDYSLDVAWLPTCGKRPGAVGPAQTVGRCPLASRSGSINDAVRGSGRHVAGWPAWDHRRPGGSWQVAVGLPPALPPSAVGSGAPANGRAQPHASAVFLNRSTKGVDCNVLFYIVWPLRKLFSSDYMLCNM